jgi:hypothetical protein
MTVRYGDNCVSQRKVYGWVERFKGGLMSVDGDARCGWPSNVTHVEVMEQIYQRIQDNRIISIDELIICVSVREIIGSDLG